MTLFQTLRCGLTDLVFPKNCVLCHGYLGGAQLSEVLCLFCLKKIELNKPPFCLKCSRSTGFNQSLCTPCQQNSFQFDQALSVTVYNDAMRKLLHAFKYGNKTSLRNFFQGLFSDYIQSSPNYFDDLDWLIPVPLYPTRLRERGYNQAEILAQEISHLTRLPIDRNHLLRRRPTRNQAAIGRKDRFTNIYGAFRINQTFDLKEKSILLIDDLLTTGTTASEAARVLKEAGAKTVKVLTLAAAV